MIQYNKEQRKIEIVLNNFCECMGRCFATALKINGLFEVDKDKKVTFIDMFQDEGSDAYKLYADAVAYENKIIFTPCAAKNIAIYDVVNNQLKNVHIREFDGYLYYKSGSKFCASIVYGKCVYMFPETYPAILKLDMDTSELDYIYIEFDKEYCFKKGLSLSESKVILPSTKSNIYMEFDLYSNDIVIKQIDNVDGSTGIWSICCDTEEETTWMVSYPKTSVLKLQKDIKIIDEFPSDFEDYGFPFTMSFFREDYFYLCPMSANMFVRIHKDTLIVEKVIFDNIDNDREQLMYLGRIDNHLSFCIYKRGEKVLQAIESGNVFLDDKTLELYRCVFYISNVDDFSKAYVKNCYNGKCVESSLLGLNEYIDVVENHSACCLKSNIGKIIHTRMMEDK